MRFEATCLRMSASSMCLSENFPCRRLDPFLSTAARGADIWINVPTRAFLYACDTCLTTMIDYRIMIRCGQLSTNLECGPSHQTDRFRCKWILFALLGLRTLYALHLMTTLASKVGYESSELICMGRRPQPIGRS